MSMRMWVWHLASLSGLRIHHCCRLQCRLQMPPGSCVAVVQAGSFSSDWITSLRTFIYHRCSPKETQTKNKKIKKINDSFPQASWVVCSNTPIEAVLRALTLSFLPKNKHNTPGCTVNYLFINLNFKKNIINHMQSQIHLKRNLIIVN